MAFSYFRATIESTSKYIPIVDPPAGCHGSAGYSQ